MKRRSNLFLSGLIVSTLLCISGFLFIENRFYKNQNRALFLQNDSIMSENIELKDSVDSFIKAVSDDSRNLKLYR